MLLTGHTVVSDDRPPRRKRATRTGRAAPACVIAVLATVEGDPHGEGCPALALGERI